MFSKREITLLGILGAIGLIVLLGWLIFLTRSGSQPEALPTPVPPENTATLAPPENTATPSETTPTATAAPVAGDDSWARIQAAGRIVVGTAADYPPFEYYGEDLQLDGFDIALMREIGQRLGVAVEFRDMAFDGLGNALELGEIDVAIGALSVTPEREQIVAFSNVYYVGEDAIVGQRDTQLAINSIADMQDRRVGAQRGSVYESWLQTRLVDAGLTPQENLFVYERIEQALPDLNEGRLDLAVLDRQPAQLAVDQGEVTIAGRGLNPQRYAMAVKRGAVSLQEQLNGALTGLQNEGRLAQLVEQYLNLAPTEQIPPPTPASPTPTPVPPAPTLTPTPTRCIDGLSLVQHLSYDDGGMTAPPLLQPGQAFVKSWRVNNSGTCAWDSSYTLRYAGGNHPSSGMLGQPLQIQGQVLPGASYDLHVNLVAPVSPGVYQGFWQLTNGDGVAFGERISVGIQVPIPPTPTVAPTQTPVAGIDFGVDRTQIVEGECVVFRWNVTNVKAVYFYPEGGTWQNSGVNGQDQRQVCPDRTKPYFLRVVKRDDSVETRQIVISVEPRVESPRIAVFEARPQPQIQVGECVALEWRVEGNVSLVKVLRNDAPLWDGAPLSGSMEDCPPGTGEMVYTLEATGPGGTSRAKRTVSVVQPPPTPVPTATPAPSPDPLVGTEWMVVDIGGYDVLPGTALSLSFIPGNNVQGNGGCNTYGGTYSVDDDRLAISITTSTQVSCDDSITQQEGAFLAALESAATFKVGPGRLRIRDASGATVLRFAGLVAVPQ